MRGLDAKYIFGSLFNLETRTVTFNWIRKMRVYVAGPLTLGDRIENIRNAIEAADRIAKRGHFPFIPHLFDMWAFGHPENDYEFWMSQDFAWLEVCDAIVRLPGKSNGADREVSKAYDLNKKIYYGLDEFMASPEWVPKEETKEATP
jgi:hypothetical protein